MDLIKLKVLFRKFDSTEWEERVVYVSTNSSITITRNTFNETILTINTVSTEVGNSVEDLVSQVRRE